MPVVGAYTTIRPELRAGCTRWRFVLVASRMHSLALRACMADPRRFTVQARSASECIYDKHEAPASASTPTSNGKRTPRLKAIGMDVRIAIFIRRNPSGQARMALSECKLLHGQRLRKLTLRVTTAISSRKWLMASQSAQLQAFQWSEPLTGRSTRGRSIGLIGKRSIRS